MPFDYSTPPPASALNLIPKDTVALVQLSINAGGVGEDGMLTSSRDGACSMLAYSAAVIDGPYAGRKIFGQWIVEGAPEKYEENVWRSRKVLKRILLSAFNFSSSDNSPEVKARLTVGYQAFHGLKFIARIGIEKGNDVWPDKNSVIGAVTRDQRDWPGPVPEAPPFNGGGPSPSPVASPAGASPASPAPIARPPWAQE
jgi:hypothetical protein